MYATQSRLNRICCRLERRTWGADSSPHPDRWSHWPCSSATDQSKWWKNTDPQRDGCMEGITQSLEAFSGFPPLMHNCVSTAKTLLCSVEQTDASVAPSRVADQHLKAGVCSSSLDTTDGTKWSSGQFRSLCLGWGVLPFFPVTTEMY